MAKPAATMSRKVESALSPDSEPEQCELERSGGGVGPGAVIPAPIESLPPLPVESKLELPALSRLALEVPFLPVVDPGFVTTHLDLQLTHRQARTLKAVFQGLHDRHEKMLNGRHVDTVAHVLPWMLDRLGADASPVSSSIKL